MNSLYLVHSAGEESCNAVRAQSRKRVTSRPSPCSIGEPRLSERNRSVPADPFSPFSRPRFLDPFSLCYSPVLLDHSQLLLSGMSGIQWFAVSEIVGLGRHYDLS